MSMRCGNDGSGLQHADHTHPAHQGCAPTSLSTARALRAGSTAGESAEWPVREHVLHLAHRAASTASGTAAESVTALKVRICRILSFSSARSCAGALLSRTGTAEARHLRELNIGLHFIRPC